MSDILQVWFVAAGGLCYFTVCHQADRTAGGGVAVILAMDANRRWRGLGCGAFDGAGSVVVGVVLPVFVSLSHARLLATANCTNKPNSHHGWLHTECQYHASVH